MFLDDLKILMNDFTDDLKRTGHASDASSFVSCLRTFREFLSERPYITCVADITRSDIDDYIEYLNTVNYRAINPYRPSFVYRRLRALGHFFDYLVIIEDEIPVNMIPSAGLLSQMDFPAPNRRGVKHFPTWFDRYIHQKILDLPSDKNTIKFRTMMLFIYHTGARSLDVATTEIDALHKKYGRNWIRIFSNKMRREYDIPIVDELAHAVEEYIKTLEDEENAEQIQPVTKRKVVYLFIGDRDPECFKAEFSRKLKKFSEQVIEDAKRDGFDTTKIEELNITSHKFRHNVGIKLIRMGADPLAVAEFLGHSDLSMAQAYIQEDEEYIDEVYEELELDKLEDVEPIIVERKDLLATNEIVSKTSVGWCVSICGNTPCGDDPYTCWKCEHLQPKDTEEYREYLDSQLAIHQSLLERNTLLGFDNAAEQEKSVIERIRSFQDSL